MRMDFLTRRVESKVNSEPTLILEGNDRFLFPTSSTSFIPLLIITQIEFLLLPNPKQPPACAIAVQNGRNFLGKFHFCSVMKLSFAWKEYY